MTRAGYLDWLRGVATLLMIEAHTYDAWTRAGDRPGLPYRAVIALGGFAAPAFLFLAGVALALAAASARAAREERRRGRRRWRAAAAGRCSAWRSCSACSPSSSAAAAFRRRC